jgi:hypothetical protein
MLVGLGHKRFPAQQEQHQGYRRIVDEMELTSENDAHQSHHHHPLGQNNLRRME